MWYIFKDSFEPLQIGNPAVNFYVACPHKFASLLHHSGIDAEFRIMESNRRAELNFWEMTSQLVKPTLINVFVESQLETNENDGISIHRNEIQNVLPTSCRTSC